MRKYIKKYRWFFLGALLCILLGTLFGVVLQFFKGEVLDYALAGQTQTTVKYAILLAAFILCEVLFYFGYGQLQVRFSVGCTKSLKSDIFRSILDRSYIRYRETPQGGYIAKYTTEADSVKARYFDMWLLFFEILCKIIFVSAALFLLDWRIAVVTLILLTTPLYLPKLIEKRLQNAQSAYMEANAENLTRVNDWLSGFEIIKNFSIERKIMEKFGESNEHVMKRRLGDSQLGVVAQLITTLISYLSYFIVLVCATRLVLRGDFSAGDFFVAIGMIDQLSWPLISLAQIIRQLVAIKPTCKALEEFIAVAESTEKKDLTEFKKEICFDNVTFGYKESAHVLENFEFRIQKGRRYLFRGSSGCGKTTAVNLLLRYFDVNSGRILIDGNPISDFGSTYGCMTVLRQEAILFHDTLRNNLTMYRDAEDAELIQLLAGLGLEKFANKAALDVVITENGSNLSGGEKKRVCLARALLRNTDVLILDEPLANLDDETAGRIEDLLLSISGKTMIVVSHQFSESKLGKFDKVLDLGKSNI